MRKRSDICALFGSAVSALVRLRMPDTAKFHSVNGYPHTTLEPWHLGCSPTPWDEAPARRHLAVGMEWIREVSVAKEDRGFASMDRAKQREIASKGGKAAHAKGRAHEWTAEEAREAGRKGGIASHRRRRESESPDPDPMPPAAPTPAEQ